MARRRSSAGGGASLDSLLDTMTNVVGILIIVLIVTQLGVGQAVERIKGFVDKVSEEEYTQIVARSEELQQILEQERERFAELDEQTPQRKLTLEQQQQLAENLKQELKKLSGKQIDPKELQKQVQERTKQVQQIEKLIQEKSETIASLKARLADTPAVGPDLAAKVVNLPDPRGAPPGAKPVVFFCRTGRIVPLDKARLQQAAQEVLRGAEKVLLRKEGLDCQRLTNLFQKRFVGDRYNRLAIRIAGDAKPRLAVQQREETGDQLKTISRRNSLFNGWLRRLNPKKQYIEFRVWPDGFDVYLAARNEAARRGISAGWIPMAASSEYWIDLGIEIKTTCIGRTPAPPSSAPPRDPNKPPPPPDVVD